jgi:hypothetical protein
MTHQEDRPAPDVAQAEAAMHRYLAEQSRATPHRDVSYRDVSYAEIEQKLTAQGHSRGAIFEAWNRRQRGKRSQ